MQKLRNKKILYLFGVIGDESGVETYLQELLRSVNGHFHTVESIWKKLDERDKNNLNFIQCAAIEGRIDCIKTSLKVFDEAFNPKSRVSPIIAKLKKFVNVGLLEPARFYLKNYIKGPKNRQNTQPIEIGEKWPCPKCGESPFNEDELKEHLAKTHIQESYRRKQSNKQFPSSVNRSDLIFHPKTGIEHIQNIERTKNIQEAIRLIDEYLEKCKNRLQENGKPSNDYRSNTSNTSDSYQKKDISTEAQKTEEKNYRCEFDKCHKEFPHDELKKYREHVYNHPSKCKKLVCLWNGSICKKKDGSEYKFSSRRDVVRHLGIHIKQKNGDIRVRIVPQNSRKKACETNILTKYTKK